MKIIEMFASREPNWLQADEQIIRWEMEDLPTLVRIWRRAKQNSLDLRAEIIQIVEDEGECQLQWKGTSENLHSYYATLWAEAMPEYEFEIGANYHCIVRKK